MLLLLVIPYFFMYTCNYLVIDIIFSNQQMHALESFLNNREVIRTTNNEVVSLISR